MTPAAPKSLPRPRRHRSGSPAADDSQPPGVAMLGSVDPLDRLRSAGKRVTDPAEALAQRVAERAIDLVAAALDVNALIQRVDIDEILSHVDVDALLDRVDVNALVERVDVGMLVEQTDLGAVIARSSGGVASEALDALRSQAVGLDGFIDRWAWRLRRGGSRPSGPALMRRPAEP
jgi:hypothetical protein